MHQLMQVQGESLFFTTEAEIARWGENYTGNFSIQKDFYLTPFELHYSFRMMYNFNLSASRLITTSRTVYRPFPAHGWGNSHKKTDTLLLNQSGAVHRHVSPNPAGICFRYQKF